MSDTIHTLAQRCYDLAVKQDRPTRDVAGDIVRAAPGRLVAALAVEYLVAAVSDAQRSATLEAERAATKRRRAGGIPRAGTKERYEWEASTPEGQEYAAAEERRFHAFVAEMAQATDRFVEAMRVEWTNELLDSSFALRDGSMVTWGDATVEQHEERRQMFVRNAAANVEGAARHEIALRELRASGAPSLRLMLSQAGAA